MAYFLIAVGLGILLVGAMRRLRHAEVEQAPRGLGTSPAPLRRVVDLGWLIVGVLIVVLGVSVMTYQRDGAPMRDAGGGPAAATSTNP